jgi:hypothetical protein
VIVSILHHHLPDDLGILGREFCARFVGSYRIRPGDTDDAVIPNEDFSPVTSIFDTNRID